MNDTYQVIELFIDTEQYSDLIRELNLRSIDFSEHKTDVYSEKEIATAEVLYMSPAAFCAYPEPHGDGTYLDLSYDITSKCIKCGQFKTQIHPLRTLKPKMGRNAISAIYWVEEFVIVEQLKNILEKENITGIDFWPVINHKKNTAWEEIYQLRINNFLPTMQAEAIERSDIPECICGVEGFMLKHAPIYNREDLKNMKDFNKSVEWLGASHHTIQHVIVSKKVYNIFKEKKIRGVRFIPVEIRD